jgi:hypothetical protein
MSFGISIAGGGTHAGWRRVKERPADWHCYRVDPETGNSHFVRGYWVKCPIHGTRRPEKD